jgi:hypothetical protein
MNVTATETLKTYRASVIAARFEIATGDVKKLKAGGVLALEDDVASDMIAAALAVMAESTVAAPPPQPEPSDTEDD